MDVNHVLVAFLRKSIYARLNRENSTSLRFLRTMGNSRLASQCAMTQRKGHYYTDFKEILTVFTESIIWFLWVVL
jgi:hypothetical protein